MLRAQLARDLDRCFAESKARLEKGVEAAFGDLRRKCSRVPGRDDAERAEEIVAATATAPPLSTPAASHVFPDPKHGPDLASSTSSTTSTTRPLRVSSSGIATDEFHESEVAASSSNPAPVAAATGISVSSVPAVAPASSGVPSLVASATTRSTSPGGDTGAAPYNTPLVSTGPIGAPASTMQSEATPVLETPVTCSTLGLYPVANAIQVNKVPLPELVVSPEQSAAFSSSTSMAAVSASDDSELALATPTMCSTKCPGEANNATRATPAPTAAPLASSTSAVPATCEVGTEVSSMALMDISISAPTPTKVTATQMYPLSDLMLGTLALCNCLTECPEIGTHTAMLGDAQPSAQSHAVLVSNTQLVVAHKLCDEKPWHADIIIDSKFDMVVMHGNVPVVALTTLNTNSSGLGQELRPLPWLSFVHSQEGGQLNDDCSLEALLGRCITETLLRIFLGRTLGADTSYGVNKEEFFSAIQVRDYDPSHEKLWDPGGFYSCAWYCQFWMVFVNSKGRWGVHSEEPRSPLRGMYELCYLRKPHKGICCYHFSFELHATSSGADHYSQVTAKTRSSCELIAVGNPGQCLMYVQVAWYLCITFVFDHTMQILAGLRSLFTSSGVEVYSLVHAEVRSLCSELFGIGMYQSFVRIFGDIIHHWLLFGCTRIRAPISQNGEVPYLSRTTDLEGLFSLVSSVVLHLPYYSLQMISVLL